MQSIRHAEITVLVDNHVDMLLTEQEGVSRFGMLAHFSPPRGVPICTENGISFWIEVEQAERTSRVLFDTGLRFRPQTEFRGTRPVT